LAAALAMPTAPALAGTAANVDEMRELMPCKLMRDILVCGEMLVPLEVDELRAAETRADLAGGGPLSWKEFRIGETEERGDDGRREWNESKLRLASSSSTTRSDAKKGGISIARGVRGKAGSFSAEEREKKQ